MGIFLGKGHFGLWICGSVILHFGGNGNFLPKYGSKSARPWSLPVKFHFSRIFTHSSGILPQGMSHQSSISKSKNKNRPLIETHPHSMALPLVAVRLRWMPTKKCSFRSPFQNRNAMKIFQAGKVCCVDCVGCRDELAAIHHSTKNSTHQFQSSVYSGLAVSQPAVVLLQACQSHCSAGNQRKSCW